MMLIFNILKKWILEFVYVMSYPFILKLLQRKQSKIRFKIYDGKESIKLIIKNELSISRFGDGEFNIIFSKGGYPSFQNFTPELKDRLLEVLKYNNTKDGKLMIAVPYIMYKTGNIKRKDASLWIKIGLKNIDRTVLLLKDDRYLDSMCFNRWISVKNNKFTFPDYSLIKQIWTDKKITLIEGTTARIGIDDDLLDNVGSVERIIIPDSNSFQKIYKHLVSWIINNIEKNRILMISAGPMGTIASYDLYMQGYRTLDIGHISYNYRLSGQSKSCIDIELMEKKYKEQIVCKFD